MVYPLPSSTRLESVMPAAKLTHHERLGSKPASTHPSASDESDVKQENERLKAELEYIRGQLLLLQNQEQKSSSKATTHHDSVGEATTRRASFQTTVLDKEPLMRRRKEEISPVPQLHQQQVLHHRHFSVKSPRGSQQHVGHDVDCEHGMEELHESALPNMPLLSNNPQQCSNLLADSMDPIHFLYQVQDRAQWLVGLLVLQSMSSFIIARNEALLQKHLVLVQFLTMLVGAGGNAGNQSSVRVIRGLATGQINNTNMRTYLVTELKMACILCMILGTAGCVRTLLFFVPIPETVAITTSLCIIVICSIILGAILPLAMRAINIDPAHSSTTIQVLMDIMGVTITVCTSLGCGAVTSSVPSQRSPHRFL